MKETKELKTLRVLVSTALSMDIIRVNWRWNKFERKIILQMQDLRCPLSFQENMSSNWLNESGLLQKRARAGDARLASLPES